MVKMKFKERLLQATYKAFIEDHIQYAVHDE